MECLSLSLLPVLLFLIFHSQISSSSSSGPQCHPDESSALLQLKGSFLPDSSMPSSWNESTDCCKWEGITCDGVTGHVIGLDLYSGTVKGTINSNSSLFFLRHLQWLLLIEIDFRGSPILPEFGQFKNLAHLDLSYSNFSGHVPMEISYLSKLDTLKLPGNQITMEEDTFKALAKNLTNLMVLDLSRIDMSSVSPISLMNMSSLTDLDLSSSMLHGELPSKVFQMPKLEALDLSRNNLNGQIPCSVLNLQRLSDFDLSHNNFTGQLPQVCSNSSQKSTLDGSWKLTELAFLGLSSNNLTGTIEFEMFSKLKKLQGIDLSSNNLSISFSYSINHTFDSLSSLSLSSCNVSEFPHFLRYSKRLNLLNLSFNQIQGSVPKWFLEVSKDSMQLLDISHNFLTHMEPLPWDSLEFLDLSSNRFSGPLPIPTAPRLTYLLASKNQFSGDIPTSICSFTELELVDLSHNNFSGNIPQCMGYFSQSLTTVDLQMNKLQGPIPTTFAKANSLRNINLSGNQLEGTLPRSLVHCSHLEVLDVGNNQLKDTFPDWLESLPNLQVLILRANKFNGSIENPKTISPFRELRILDISYNEFKGTLPLGYIENFHAMMEAERIKMEYMKSTEGAFLYYFYSVVISMKGFDVQLVKIQTILTAIDFSSNNFTGEIPMSIGRLRSLKGLNFSHNKLGGIIPSSLGSLTNLEWLDLSSNVLVGRIPDQLVGIPWLAFLNLSQNRLVGPIPIGAQFNTFNNDSYSGNLGLCGFPLSNLCGKVRPNQGSDGEHDAGMFDWKVVMMGYASGMVIGISVGYMVLFSRGGDYWFQKRFGRRQRHISIAPLRGKRRN